MSVYSEVWQLDWSFSPESEVSVSVSGSHPFNTVCLPTPELQ